MDLKNKQLKEAFGNLVTIGTTAGTPTTGVLENGNGDDITTLNIQNGTARGISLGTDTSGTGSRAFMVLDSDGSDGVGGGGDYLLFLQDGTTVTDLFIPDTSVFTLKDFSNTRLTILANGNVGIGSTNPDAPLTIHNSSDPEIRFGYSASQDHRISYDSSKVNLDADPDNANASSGLGLRVDGTMGLFIDDSHNVAIGTNAPIEVSSDSNWVTLDSSSTSTVSGGIVHAINGSSKAVQYVYSSNVLYDAKSGIGHQFTVNNGSEVMRMDTASRMLVGKTSSGLGVEGVEFNTSSHFTNFTRERNSAGGTLLQINRTGSEDGSVISFMRSGSEKGSITVTSSATAFNTSSDYRLKENITPLSSCLDVISKMKPSTFNFIDTPEVSVDGFIAHELADVVPYAVSGEKDGIDEDGDPIYQGVDHSKLVPLLVGAIQELKEEIEQLKNK